jgi:hypothetical protein
MSGGLPPLPHYVSMAWCSVKSTGTTLLTPWSMNLLEKLIKNSQPFMKPEK